MPPSGTGGDVSCSHQSFPPLAGLSPLAAIFLTFAAGSISSANHAPVAGDPQVAGQSLMPLADSRGIDVLSEKLVINIDAPRKFTSNTC